MKHRVSVVTCNRDRWAFETQYRLIAALGYTGEYSIWCNEIRQSSWRRWFDRLQRTVPTSAQVQLHTVSSIPGLWQLTNRTPGNPWQDPYWQQQICKLYDAWCNPLHTTLSLDSKTWPIHTEFYLSNLLKNTPKFRPSTGPFSRTLDFSELWTGRQPADLTRGNLPPWQLHGAILVESIPDWPKFLEALRSFDWGPSTFSEYFFVEHLYTTRGYTGSGVVPNNIVYTTYNGNLERLEYLLSTGRYHTFTHKWHDPTETDLIPHTTVQAMVTNSVYLGKRPRC